MRDCKLIVTVRDDKVNFEGQDISVEELAQIAGFLQVFVGMEGLKRGLDMDDVKNNMLDIHLAAMETLEEQLRAGKLEEDELVGTFISEMALIDEDGDVVAFSNFLAKGKDETEVTFTIEDNY